jgi:WD40 repeat protein
MRYLFFVISIFIMEYYVLAQDIIQLGKGDVYDFRFSPQGYLAYISNGKSVDIWDIHLKSVIGVLKDGPNNTIISIDITKDSAYLVASSLDSVITIWNLTNYSLIKKIKIRSIANSVVFNNKTNDVIAGLRNGDLFLINSITGDIANQKAAIFTEITNLALLENLDYLAVSSSDGMIKLLNSASLKFYDQTKAHSNFVRGIVFSDDGKRFYSCGDDGKVACTNIFNFRLAEDSYVHSSLLRKPWIMSVDYLTQQVLAFASIRGDVFIETNSTVYFKKISDKIFKLRFLPMKNTYIAVALATNNGLKIIWASKMETLSK